MSDVSEYLSIYLGGPGEIPGIGPERGRATHDGIARFRSPHGSVRYVLYRSGEPLAALQVVTPDGRHATIANVYTLPSHRRQGLADALLEKARRDFSTVAHAQEGSLSAAGRAWRDRRGSARDLDADIERAIGPTRGRKKTR